LIVSSGTATAGIKLRTVVDVDTYVGWKSITVYNKNSYELR